MLQYRLVLALTTLVYVVGAQDAWLLPAGGSWCCVELCLAALSMGSDWTVIVQQGPLPKAQPGLNYLCLHTTILSSDKIMYNAYNEIELFAHTKSISC